MKYLILALALIPTFAHAGYVCNSYGDADEIGYHAMEQDDGTMVVTQDGTKKALSLLECQDPLGSTRNPALPHPVLSCGHSSPSGYHVYVAVGGFVGISATLLLPSKKTVGMLCIQN